MNTERFVRHLEKQDDEVWVRYSRIVDMARSINTNQMLKEVTRMHQSRSSRRLMLKDHITADALIKANLEEMSYRSTLVDINVKASKLHRKLSIALDATTNHITANYFAYLKETAGLRAKTDVITFVEALLSDGWDYHSRLDYVMDVCKQVIGDIDQAGWSMNRSVELMRIVAARESVIKQASI